MRVGTTLTAPSATNPIPESTPARWAIRFSRLQQASWSLHGELTGVGDARAPFSSGTAGRILGSLTDRPSTIRNSITSVLTTLRPSTKAARLAGARYLPASSDRA